jgi:hypothetical protein
MIVFLNLGANAQIPVPHGISGMVLMSDGITQAPSGTHFSVNNTETGHIKEGTTGGPPGNSGRYSVPVSGEDGDKVIIRAWNGSHYGMRTVTLSGDMTGIDIVLGTPLSDLPAESKILHEMDEASGSGNSDSSSISGVEPSNIKEKENNSVTEIPLTPAKSTENPAPEPSKMTGGFEIITALAVLLVICASRYKIR